MTKKIYNKQTKGYRIRIFVDDQYLCSTDFKKTCKEAKARFIEVQKEKYPEMDTSYLEKHIKCYFVRQ